MTELDARREFIEKLATAAYDKAATFTTIVIGGGFAGLFGIWGWVANYLYRWQMLAIGFTLGLSLSLFVAWQVLSMVMLANQQRRFAMAILASDADFDALMAQLGPANNKASALIMKFWPAAIWMIAAPAAIGALLLVIACAEHLVTAH